MKALIKTILLVVVVSSLSFGQNVKIKKNTVYLDKEPVAVYEGKASALKGVDLQFYTNNKQPLFDLKQVWVFNEHPELDSRYWHLMTITESGEQFRFSLDNLYTSDKKIVKKVIEKAGAEIFNGNIELAEKNDESTEILADSLKIVEFRNEISTALKEGHIERADSALVFKSARVKETIDRDESTFRTYQMSKRYNIYQAEEFIGWVTRENDISQENSPYVRYRIYKKLKREFEVNGKTTNKLLAAQAEFNASVEPSPELVTFQDHTKNRLGSSDEPDNLRGASKDLVDFMVRNGYL